MAQFGEPSRRLPRTDWVRLNSDRCWVTAEGSIARDADGRPLRVRGITHDITERKKAELALAEREAQLRLAGKAARVGSFAIDYATERIQTSPGYVAIHGLAEGTEELTREEWRARVHPDDLRALTPSAAGFRRATPRAKHRVSHCRRRRQSLVDRVAWPRFLRRRRTPNARSAYTLISQSESGQRTGCRE
jgi:PAS domain-containing protein